LLLFARITIFVRSHLLLNAIARSRAVRRALSGLLMLTGASRALYAASATPFAAPVQQSAAGSAGGLLRVILALIVVLAAVLAAAWLARRMRAFSGGGSSASLEMLAQLPLGTRERAVLVRVGDCRVLIGVAPGNVRTLHVLGPAPLPLAEAAASADAAAPANDPAARPTFKALLLRSLGK
jgi:flagellar protein FliO/FliZ